MFPEWPLTRFRTLLCLQVRLLDLDPRLRRRFDSSDLVQEAMTRAYERRDQFRGGSEGEALRWLQAILHNVVLDKIREAHAARCDIGRERSLQAVTDSSARFEAFLTSKQRSPAEEFEGRELLLRLAEALEQLPADQRDVFIHVRLRGTPRAEVALALEKTPKAVVGLLCRAQEKLAELLKDIV